MEQTVLNDRYEIQEKIGEGGMATVYMGHDARLNRRVAIKILHGRYVDDDEFVARFQHEAQAAANLNHVNVVRVYDVGQDGDTHYIVMECIDGTNLKTIINRDAPLKVGEAVNITEAIAQGLEAAHRVGLVHRDIKPQNIMVASDGTIRIADFGIAKSHLSQTLTQSGIIGTADYISPEQAQGKGATPRSDIYSLGVTLYEMLTGRLPFVGDGPLAVAMQHVSAAPLPPRQINPLVPPHVEALVLQALSKDPLRRPEGAQAFAELLRTYRDMANQQTMVGTDAMPYPSAAGSVPPGVSPVGGSAGSRPITGKLSSSSTGRMIPPKPRLARAPDHGGVGFLGAILVILILLLVGGGMVFLVTSGIFDFQSTIAGDDPEPKPTRVLPLTLTGETPIATDEIVATPTPSFTATPTPTLTTTPTPTETPVPKVTVPDITGMTEDVAQQTMQEVGLVPSRSDVVYSDSVPEGAVVEQFVPAYSEVEEGVSVSYTVSQGPEITLVEAPDLTFRRLDSARREAEQLGLAVEVYQEPSRDISEGFIIRQEPNPKMRVESGDTIRLYVSMGDVVMVPDLREKFEEEAKRILAATDGLTWSYSDQQGPDKLGTAYYQLPEGIVVSTIPEEGSWVPRGTVVTLGIRAYEATPTPATESEQGSDDAGTSGEESHPPEDDASQEGEQPATDATPEGNNEPPTPPMPPPTMQPENGE